MQALSGWDERLREIPLAPAEIDAYRLEIETAIAGRAPGETFGARVVLGELERIAGKPEQAVALQTELVREAEETGNAARSIGARLRLAESLRYAGETVGAEELFRTALAMIDAYPAEGERYRHFALQHLGKCLIDASRYDEALAALDEALRIRLALDDATLIESTERAIALIEAQRAPSNRDSEA